MKEKELKKAKLASLLPSPREEGKNDANIL
jgi:hypothetical protein